MNTYQKRKAAGVCVRCGKREPIDGKTKCEECTEEQREHWRKWAKDHPEEAQANRDKWAETPKGKKAMKRAVERRVGNPEWNRKRRNWRKGRKADES